MISGAEKNTICSSVSSDGGLEDGRRGGRDVRARPGSATARVDGFFDRAAADGFATTRVDGFFDRAGTDGFATARFDGLFDRAGAAARPGALGVTGFDTRFFGGRAFFAAFVPRLAPTLDAPLFTPAIVASCSHVHATRQCIDLAPFRFVSPKTCDGVRAHGTIRSVTVTVTVRPGPSLAKTRGERLLAIRSASLVRTSDHRFRELLAKADSVSEGGARAEGDGPVWYGSTSLVVPLPLAGEPERRFFVEIAKRDPHVRLRAIRLAKHEATTRAPRPLGPASCEVRFSSDDRGLRIDVDLQAPLIEERRRPMHRAGVPSP